MAIAHQENSNLMKKYIVFLMALTSLVSLMALGLLSCNNPKATNQQLIENKMITKEITFTPEGVCTKQIDISVENDTIRSVQFTKGCAGNTQGVARLIEGMHIDDAIAKLEGIRCGDKETSCPDQLARALKSMK
jgi:uncharacterized protein (TIGR03905 family)